MTFLPSQNIQKGLQMRTKPSPDMESMVAFILRLPSLQNYKQLVFLHYKLNEIFCNSSLNAIGLWRGKIICS